MTDYRTVDGVPIKLGDRVWFARPGSRVTHRAINKVDLGMWWEALTSKQAYSTERAALTALLAHERRALGKARDEARRATRSIGRLTELLIATSGVKRK